MNLTPDSLTISRAIVVFWVCFSLAKAQLIFMSLFSYCSTLLSPGTEKFRLVYLDLTVHYVVDVQGRPHSVLGASVYGAKWLVTFVAALGQIMCCCPYIDQVMTE